MELLSIILVLSMFGLVVIGSFAIFSLLAPELISITEIKFWAKWLLIICSVAFLALGVIEGSKFYKELKQMEIDADNARHDKEMSLKYPDHTKESIGSEIIDTHDTWPDCYSCVILLDYINDQSHADWF